MSVKIDVKGLGYAWVAEEDADRVKAHTWRSWNGYPHNTAVGFLHQFIIGPRPVGVPGDWVVDHKSRVRANAHHSNLRWVTPAFNAWNRTMEAMSSRFRGVSWNRPRRKWVVFFLGKYIGGYEDEKEAALVSAEQAVQAWKHWAWESDLLFGPELLTRQEVEDFMNRTQVLGLPMGVQLVGGRYRATHQTKTLGIFATPAEAETCKREYVRAKKSEEWETHLKLPITRDASQRAVIALGGDAGQGSHAIVPESLWHRLTFKAKWSLAKEYAVGRWHGKKLAMHAVIARCLWGEYDGRYSVDHIISEQKLNNGEDNLRLATKSLQRNNIRRKPSKTGIVGVSKSYNRWLGAMRFCGRLYKKSFATEAEAERFVLHLRAALHGV